MHEIQATIEDEFVVYSIMIIANNTKKLSYN